MNAHSTSADGTRRRVIAVAAIETIGTAGALIGFGWKIADPARAFRLAGFALFGNMFPNASLLANGAILLGVVHHVLISMAWGALLSVSIVTFRARARVIACVLAVAIFAALQLTELPPILRIGYTVTYDRAQMVGVSVSVALSLLMAWWTLLERRSDAAS